MNKNKQSPSHKSLVIISGILILLSLIMIILANIPAFWEKALRIPDIFVEYPLSSKMLLGSNLGAWGMNSDGTINEPFVNNSTQRSMAARTLGTIRMPTRSNLTDQAIITLVDSIRSAGLEPLVILPAADLTRAERYVRMLGSKVTFYEFGNEDNYFKGWSGTTYASYWKSALPVLRAANGDAQFGGPVVSHVSPTGSMYIAEFLESIKSDSTLYPDFISFHLYSEQGEDKTSAAVLDDVATWGARVDWIRNTTKTKLGIELPIACTEWNWDAAPENTGDNRDMDITFMNQFTKAVLDQWRTHGVWMSHQYGLGAGMGGGHLQMINSSTAKPQYNAFVDYLNSGVLDGATPQPTVPPPTVSPTPSTQSVVGLTLVNINNQTKNVNLTHGITINSSELTMSCMSIQAHTSPQTVGSVRFDYDGQVNYRTENNNPYYIGSDDSNGITCWTLTTGNHTLTATPFSAAQAAGTAGTPLTVSFTVGNATPVPTPTASPIPTPLPTVPPTIAPTPTPTPGSVVCSSANNQACGYGSSCSNYAPGTTCEIGVNGCGTASSGNNIYTCTNGQWVYTSWVKSGSCNFCSATPTPVPTPTPSPTPIPNPYDLNHDGVLNTYDFNLFKQLYAQKSLEVDFNQDGKVNIADFNLFKKMYKNSNG